MEDAVRRAFGRRFEDARTFGIGAVQEHANGVPEFGFSVRGFEHEIAGFLLLRLGARRGQNAKSEDREHTKAEDLEAFHLSSHSSTLWVWSDRHLGHYPPRHFLT